MPVPRRGFHPRASLARSPLSRHSSFHIVTHPPPRLDSTSPVRVAPRVDFRTGRTPFRLLAFPSELSRIPKRCFAVPFFRDLLFLHCLPTPSPRSDPAPNLDPSPCLHHIQLTPSPYLTTECPQPDVVQCALRSRVPIDGGLGLALFFFHFYPVPAGDDGRGLSPPQTYHSSSVLGAASIMLPHPPFFSLLSGIPNPIPLLSSSSPNQSLFLF